MILDLDFGNSCAKWQLKNSGQLLDAGRFDYQQLDEFLVALPKDISRIRLVSVLQKNKENEICSQLKCHIGVEVEIAESTKSLNGVVNGYEDPQKLGVDRWLAIVGARKYVETACVVVDAGTAITVDCVDRNGVHLGGYIIPGLKMMVNSLVGGTGGINVNEEKIALNPGKNTAEAAGHGCINSVVGMIENVMTMMRATHQCEIELVLTGGDARRITPFISKQPICVLDLVFEGLAIALP